MTVFKDVAPCSLDRVIMGAITTSETSISASLHDSTSQKIVNAE
jgi:hypothetical protein